jgi:hypothetical protein
MPVQHLAPVHETVVAEPAGQAIDYLALLAALALLSLLGNGWQEGASSDRQ